MGHWSEPAQMEPLSPDSPKLFTTLGLKSHVGRSRRNLGGPMGLKKNGLSNNGSMIMGGNNGSLMNKDIPGSYIQSKYKPRNYDNMNYSDVTGKKPKDPLQAANEMVQLKNLHNPAYSMQMQPGLMNENMNNAYF